MKQFRMLLPLLVTRIGGVVFIVLGLVLIFV